MKRTTIMADESLLSELSHIARRQAKSTSQVIREALEQYIAEQQRQAPPESPLMQLVNLGASAEVVDLADGRDEELLSEQINPVSGWRVDENGHN